MNGPIDGLLLELLLKLYLLMKEKVSNVQILMSGRDRAGPSFLHMFQILYCIMTDLLWSGPTPVRAVVA